MDLIKNNNLSFFLETINRSFNTNYIQGDDIRSIIIDLIKRISLNENKLKEIAKRSYDHVNGFTKIVLFESEDKKVKIRLHLWGEKYQKSTISDLHDHRWSYISIPIIGELRESRFVENLEKNSCNSLKKVKYNCFSRGESEWLNLEGYEIVSLIKDTTKLHETGNVYFCAAGEIHQLEPTTLPCASIVVTFEPIKDYARVYRDKIETEDFMKIYVPNLDLKKIKESLLYVVKNA